MALKSFKKLLADAKQTDTYWFEKAKLDFSVAFNKMFLRSNLTQADLAKKLNTSQAYITKVFKADANFTIETMTKLARAVDGNLQILIIPQHRASGQAQPGTTAKIAPMIYDGNTPSAPKTTRTRQTATWQ